MTDESQPKNPLHGITLEMILHELVEFYGWFDMGGFVNIKCFNIDPSVKSSLTFLRKTPWARTKVENLYLQMLAEKEKINKRKNRLKL